MRCFRGIDTLMALSILAELHDVERFASPRQLMAYLGLVPSERSSGGVEKRGGLTKTGNRRVRRLLERGKQHNKAVAAVGRELVGFVWAALQAQES